MRSLFLWSGSPSIPSNVADGHAFAACASASKDILDLLAAGVSEADILADYPYLEADDIRACLAYAAEESDHPVLVTAGK